MVYEDDSGAAFPCVPPQRTLITKVAAVVNCYCPRSRRKCEVTRYEHPIVTRSFWGWATDSPLYVFTLIIKQLQDLTFKIELTKFEEERRNKI